MTGEQVPFWRRPIYATRLSAHLVFAAGFWPLLTLAGTAITLLNQPYLSISDGVAIKAAIAGLVLRLPDMALAGLIVFGISGFVFSRLGPVVERNRFGFARLIVEPLLTFVAVVGGMSVTYPAALNAPVLSPFFRWPVAAVVASFLTVAGVGGFFAARSGKRLHLAAAMVALGVVSPAPLMVGASVERLTGHPPDTVVLGLDSISHHDHIEPLKSWTAARRGTWYEYPVAPGLLTNAVWSSILTMKPVSVHHVFHTFERLTLAPAFLTAARASGYHTVAIFPDQVTCAVGSRAGFDKDRSGPVGWRQVLLPAVANSSFLIPIVRPVLPRLWPGASPANEAGTFTYDVRREIRGILRAGSSQRRTLVAAHLTYTHLAAYPSAVELSWDELSHVARTPVGLVQDRSFYWQDTDRPTDPIKLQTWKLEFLQRVLREEVDAARYLDGKHQLVVFSDHGHRLGLTLDTFRDPRYHHVLLATFGVPPRCPEAPISLIDIGALLGLSDTRAEPVVEFAIAPLNVWPALMNSARLEWPGDVELDPKLLAEIFAGLLRHKPWTGGSIPGRCDMRAAAR